MLADGKARAKAQLNPADLRLPTGLKAKGQDDRKAPVTGARYRCITSSLRSWPKGTRSTLAEATKWWMSATSALVIGVHQRRPGIGLPAVTGEERGRSRAVRQTWLEDVDHPVDRLDLEDDIAALVNGLIKRVITRFSGERAGRPGR